MDKVLIIMAVHDTAENGRAPLTLRTLYKTIFPISNGKKHDIVIVSNGCDREYGNLYSEKCTDFGVKFIYLPQNIGTAAAINEGILFHRQHGQSIIKIDNDVIVKHDLSWVDDMLECYKRYERIPGMKGLGVLGLKRNDLEQRPDHDNAWFKSSLRMLPHEKGEKWLITEETPDIMGTCTMIGADLLDEVGYFWQPHLYGYDDVDMAYRSHLLGYKNAFLCGVDIDHIDPGGTKYMDWKQQEARTHGEAWQERKKLYHENPKTIYYNPYD